MKYFAMGFLAFALSAVGTAMSDTFLCGFISGVICLDINDRIDRAFA